MRSHASNLAWSVGAQATYALTQWLVLVIIARSGSAETLGQFSLAMAVTAPAAMLAMLQMRTVLATDAARKHSLLEYLSIRLSLSAVAAGLTIAISVIWWRDLVFPLIALLACAKAVESMGELCQGFYQREGRMRSAFLSVAVKGCVATFSVWFILRSSSTSDWLGLGLLAGFGIGFIGVDGVLLIRELRKPASTATRSEWRWRANSALELLKFSVPLGLVTLIASLSINIPRVVAERHLGARELGFYAATAYAALAGARLVQAISHVVAPGFGRLIAEKKFDRLRSLLLRSCLGVSAFAAIAVALAFACGKPALSFIYGPEWGHANTLLIASLAVCIFEWPWIIVGTALVALKRNRARIPIEAGSFLLSVGGAFFLTPQIGILALPVAFGAGVILNLTAGLAVALASISERAKDAWGDTRAARDHVVHSDGVGSFRGGTR